MRFTKIAATFTVRVVVNISLQTTVQGELLLTGSILLDRSRKNQHRTDSDFLIYCFGILSRVDFMLKPPNSNHRSSRLNR